MHFWREGKTLSELLIYFELTICGFFSAGDEESAVISKRPA